MMIELMLQYHHQYQFPEFLMTQVDPFQATEIVFERKLCGRQKIRAKDLVKHLKYL